MQYVLTEEEYKFLTSVEKERLEAEEKQQQKFCTLAAIHIPIKQDWRSKDDPLYVSPWGCILDEENDPGYCDDCPVQDVCPNDFKKWSK